MTKRISAEEKQRRWLELQKNRMHERIMNNEPVFDGHEIKLPRHTRSYGEKINDE
jgi:hypothetical protein